jgi:hypothetical protein
MKKVSDAFQSLERFKVISPTVDCILWHKLCLCVIHALLLSIWLRKAMIALYRGNWWWYSNHCIVLRKGNLFL